jgi:hypothetical protein
MSVSEERRAFRRWLPRRESNSLGTPYEEVAHPLSFVARCLAHKFEFEPDVHFGPLYFGHVHKLELLWFPAKESNLLVSV